jgi:hypothetical protein
MTDVTDGFRFDFLTRRFLDHRWETETGRAVLEEITEGIKSCVEIRGILDPYVLVHKDNYDSWGYPYYPPDAMGPDEFWVLNNDDLRGARFANQDFSDSRSLEKKALSYAWLSNCKLPRADLYQTDFSYARLEQCDFSGAHFVLSGGYGTRLLACDLRRAVMSEVGWIDTNFDGSDLRGVYFENVRLDRLRVNHRTRVDTAIPAHLGNRALPPEQIPDILRSFRSAFADAEIWDEADRFLRAERLARRQHMTWPRVQINDPRSTSLWLGDLLAEWATGYGTQLGRVAFAAGVTALIFTVIYLVAGVPVETETVLGNALEAIYFSLTTFATLGFGDVAYAETRPMLRIVSSIEALAGAVSMALIVTVLARKWFR